MSWKSYSILVENEIENIVFFDNIIQKNKQMIIKVKFPKLRIHLFKMKPIY